MKAHIFKTRGFSKSKEWELIYTPGASLEGAQTIMVSTDKKALKARAKADGATAHNY